MAEQSVFHLISDITKQKGVDCVLIGGFAVNYYKVSRQTADVDFLITKSDFDGILAALNKAGYRKVSEQENFVQLRNSQFSLMDIDFMFVDQDTLSKIRKEAREIEIAKQKFTVPSLEHLIALKLHSVKHNPKLRKTKDLPDIINLIKINELDFEDEKFRELCLKFGTDALYAEILEALK